MDKKKAESIKYIIILITIFFSSMILLFLIMIKKEPTGVFKALDPRSSSNYVCYDISATVATRNEELLIEDSISSVAPYFGEVIIIDHGSTDSTPQIIQKLIKKYPNVHGYRVDEKLPYSEVFNAAYIFSTRPWIMKWDADFFLYPDAQRELCNLVKRSEKDDVKILWYPLPRIDGDIDHVFPWKLEGDNAEQRLVKRGYFLKRQTDKYPDTNIVTIPNVKNKMAKGVYMLHAGSFKNAERLYFRSSMTPYSIYKNIQLSKSRKPLSYWQWEYERLNVGKNASNADIDKFKKEQIKKFCNENLSPFADFDFKKWGKHPPYLKNLSFFKKFRLEYVRTDKKGNKLYRRIMPGCEN